MTRSTASASCSTIWSSRIAGTERSPRRRSASRRWAFWMAASPPLTATYMAQPSISRCGWCAAGRPAHRARRGSGRRRAGNRARFSCHWSMKSRRQRRRRKRSGRLDAGTFAAEASGRTTGFRPAGRASSSGRDIPACPARSDRAAAAWPEPAASAKAASARHVDERRAGMEAEPGIYGGRCRKLRIEPERRVVVAKRQRDRRGGRRRAAPAARRAA